MGSINLGNSVGLYVFQTPLNSDYINQQFQNIFSTGVYNGLSLSIVNNTNVTVNAGNYAISDGTYTSLWKVQTSFNMPITNATPYIVVRWVYQKIANQYPDYLALSYAELELNDVIIGKAIYNNNGLGTTLLSIDKNCQKVPNKLLFENLYNNLIVKENPFGYLSVIVEKGFIVLYVGARVNFNQTVLSIATADNTYDRIDLVIVN